MSDGPVRVIARELPGVCTRHEYAPPIHPSELARTPDEPGRRIRPRDVDVKVAVVGPSSPDVETK